MDRPLLILDVDETLIHGADSSLDRPPDFRAGEFYIYRRPFVEEFIQSVSQLYELACWSSATADYLQIILNEIIPKEINLLFCWDRSRCTRRMDFVLQEEFFLKDLRKLKRMELDLERVLILEDEPRKVFRNYGNAIYVRPYLGQMEDKELLNLATYLASITNEQNFRNLDKRSWRKNSED